MKAFFSAPEHQLRRGDIVLSRSPTLASHLIRIASGAPFSHAAMVFLTPRPQEHLAHTFVIESLFKGVGVGNLETYLSGHNAIEEAGILRFKDESLKAEFFDQANGVLLSEVNKPYDFHRLWRIALSVLFGLKRAMDRARRRPNVYRRWMPRQFICSGFIQYGLYEAAVTSGMDPARVILRNGLASPSQDQMLGTTPEDVAESDKLQWLYVVRKGWVHKVADYAEARRVLQR